MNSANLLFLNEINFYRKINEFYMLPKFNRPEMHASVIKAKLKNTHCKLFSAFFLGGGINNLQTSLNYMISVCL